MDGFEKEIQIDFVAELVTEREREGFRVRTWIVRQSGQGFRVLMRRK